MFIFETPSGIIGRAPRSGDNARVEWLVPNCLNVFRWQAADTPAPVDDWGAVRAVPDFLQEKGYTEICANTFMKTNELQLHRKQHDPVLAFLASENDMFSRARSSATFVQDVHAAVRDWPTSMPRNSMGRRFWNTVNRIADRARLDEDEKRFLSCSSASASASGA